MNLWGVPLEARDVEDCGILPLQPVHLKITTQSQNLYFDKKGLEQGMFCFKKINLGTSLVVQGLRIRLPMQRTRVRSLVREDPTCHRATKPMRHNY